MWWAHTLSVFGIECGSAEAAAITDTVSIRWAFRYTLTTVVVEGDTVLVRRTTASLFLDLHTGVVSNACAYIVALGCQPFVSDVSLLTE